MPGGSLDRLIGGDALAARYEALRGFGLGVPTRPVERAGLTAFVFRGMWGWAHTIAGSCTLRTSTAPTLSPLHSAVRDQESLVPLLATVAINFKREVFH